MTTKRDDSPPLTRHRLDLWEVLLLAAFFAWTAFFVGRSSVATGAVGEAEALQARYGPTRNSEHLEEWVIRDFFGDEKGGFFLDVGANDYRRFSNTYYLETHLGWSGIAIEPQREFEPGYLRFRPRTRFRPFFASEHSDEQARLYVSEKTDLVTSSTKDFTARWGPTAREVVAPTISLNDLLEHERVTRLDLVSIDVELHEPKVLAGFDVGRFKPRLVCIEAHPEVRQQILDYFGSRQYVLVGKYLRADTQNLYFSPAGAVAAR